MREAFPPLLYARGSPSEEQVSSHGAHNQCPPPVGTTPTLHAINHTMTSLLSDHAWAGCHPKKHPTTAARSCLAVRSGITADLRLAPLSACQLSLCACFWAVHGQSPSDQQVCSTSCPTRVSSLRIKDINTSGPQPLCQHPSVLTVVMHVGTSDLKIKMSVKHKEDFVCLMDSVLNPGKNCSFSRFSQLRQLHSWLKGYGSSGN